jgi:hypothetical protein
MGPGFSPADACCVRDTREQIGWAYYFHGQHPTGGNRSLGDPDVLRRNANQIWSLYCYRSWMGRGVGYKSNADDKMN